MKSSPSSFTFLLISSFLIVPFITGCSSSISSRLETAHVIAAYGHMQANDIATKSFALRSYERINDPERKTVRVYIEGDGLAWIDRGTPSLDPTPTNPLALSLAAADPAPNVIYLARPCQYLRAENQLCGEAYWTSEIFAPVIIQTMNEALEIIKTRYGFTQIELVGYSGGAGVALLLASQRNDIINIRTVAGNLDTDAYTKLHHISKLKKSLNPADVASSLVDIPQLHFIGGNDNIVPLAICQSFINHVPDKHCIHSEVIENVSHEEGWQYIWGDLLKKDITCRKNI